VGQFLGDSPKPSSFLSQIILHSNYLTILHGSSVSHHLGMLQFKHVTLHWKTKQEFPSVLGSIITPLLRGGTIRFWGGNFISEMPALNGFLLRYLEGTRRISTEFNFNFILWYPEGTHLVPTRYHSKLKKLLWWFLCQVNPLAEGIPKVTSPHPLARCFFCCRVFTKFQPKKYYFDLYKGKKNGPNSPDFVF
jgi:hypothetical protein